jgi:hypothetical protein
MFSRRAGITGKAFLMNSAGKLVLERVIETKANLIVQFVDGLRGDLQITCEVIARSRNQA